MPPATRVRGRYRDSRMPATGPATRSASTNGAMAIVAASVPQPWTTWKNTGAWSAGAVCARATTTPANSATVTGRTSMASVGSIRSRTCRCHNQNPRSTAIPPTNSAIRSGLNWPPSRPTSAAVMHSSPNAHKPWPAMNSALGLAPTYAAIPRRATTNATMARSPTTRKAGHRPKVGVTALNIAGAMALERPSMRVRGSERGGAGRARVCGGDRGDRRGDDQPGGCGSGDPGDRERCSIRPEDARHLGQHHGGQAHQQHPSRLRRCRRRHRPPGRSPPGPRSRAGTGSQDPVAHGAPAACRASPVRRPLDRGLPRTGLARPPRGSPEPRVVCPGPARTRAP